MRQDSFLKSALKPTIDGYFEKLLNVLKDYEVIKASEILSPEDGDPDYFYLENVILPEFDKLKGI